jgi:hypothetical protein
MEFSTTLPEGRALTAKSLNDLFNKASASKQDGAELSKGSALSALKNATAQKPAAMFSFLSVAKEQPATQPQKAEPVAKSVSVSSPPSETAKTDAAGSAPDQKEVDLETELADFDLTAIDGNGNGDEEETVVLDADEFTHPEQPSEYSEEAVKSIKNSISIIQQNLDNKELVGQAVVNVLALLKQHEFLRGILEPEDLGTMVRGLRVSYGVAVAQKQARAKKTKATNAEVDEAMSMLKGMDFKI